MAISLYLTKSLMKKVAFLLLYMANSLSMKFGSSDKKSFSFLKVLKKIKYFKDSFHYRKRLQISTFT